MKIEEIRALCSDETIEVTSHMLQRLQKRNIAYSEVKQALWNGVIIEDYPEDYPYPSCLVLGITTNSRIIHIVVGIGGDKLWLITAYEPDSDKWSEDFKVRKE